MELVIEGVSLLEAVNINTELRNSLENALAIVAEHGFTLILKFKNEWGIKNTKTGVEIYSDKYMYRLEYGNFDKLSVE